MKSNASRSSARKIRRRAPAAFPSFTNATIRYRYLKSTPPAVPEPSCWHRGFPYFGTVADALAQAGLWSRSELIRFLRGQGHCPPGDHLTYCLCDSIEEKGNIITATVALHDEDRDEWHIISLNP